MDYDIASRKIFIGGLSYATDDEKLRQYFQQYGAVHDAVVMKDPISRRSRGFGFITYENASSVDKALAQENHTIDSRQVEAKRAVPRSDTKDVPPKSATISSALPNQSNFLPSGHGQSPTLRPDNICSNAKIFVGGLHYDTRDGEFRNYFEKYGKVITSEVMFNRETHKSRGFGFVVYESEQSADDVCAVKEHYIDGKLVEVKRAVPRSKLTPMSPTPSQSSPSLKAYQQFGSSDIDSLDNFSLTPEKNKTSASSYAAALKSGQYNPVISQSPQFNHHLNEANISSDQVPIHTPSSPYSHGLLSEPVNVTGYHLRSHASSLSELDLQNSVYPFGSYDQSYQQSLHHQFDHYSFTPNSPASPAIPSRLRAQTESFLLTQSQQLHANQHHLHHHIYLRNQTTNMTSSSLNPQVQDFTAEYLRHSTSHTTSPSVHSMHSDTHSMSPIQQLNQDSSWEKFENQRGNIERSVSLGGGWTPTSLSSPSRRGMSDVGLTDISISFNSKSSLNHPNSTLQPALTEEAWSSLVDLNMGLQPSPSEKTIDNTFNVDPDELAVQLDYSMNFEQPHQYSDLKGGLNPNGLGSASPQISGSPSSLAPVNDIIVDGIQELRLQAKEFIPQSQKHHHQQQQPPQYQQWPSSSSTPPSSPSTKSSF